MKIYVCHATAFDYTANLYQPLRNSCLWQEHQWFLPHAASFLPHHSKDIIADSDLIVAEVSYPSTGMGIEIGWADIMKLPIVFMHKNDARVSTSLQLISKHFIVYANSNDMLDKLESFLQNICTN